MGHGERRRELERRFPGWEIWYVPREPDGVAWRARPRMLIGADNPEDLAAAIRAAEYPVIGDSALLASGRGYQARGRRRGARVPRRGFRPAWHAVSRSALAGGAWTARPGWVSGMLRRCRGCSAISREAAAVAGGGCMAAWSGTAAATGARLLLAPVPAAVLLTGFLGTPVWTICAKRHQALCTRGGNAVDPAARPRS